MSELVPGTPEYQEAYDKEMQRLEAEATPPKGEAKPSTTSEEPKVEAKEEPKAKTEEPKPEIDDLKKRVESLDKALKDTQAWGTRNAQELSRIKKEREQEKHNAQRPEILDKNPGLEDAIRHVANPVENQAPTNWLESVATAIPDVEELLGDQEFFKKAQDRKNSFGTQWDNPLVAIRELNDLKVTHQKEKAVQAAVTEAREQARKDFEAKHKKLSAMSVPGGSGGSGSNGSDKTDDVKKLWDMPDPDFQKMRSKVLGY